MRLLLRASSIGFVVLCASVTSSVGQTAVPVQSDGAPDNEHARQYLGPGDNSYMVLQGRIIKLEDRMAAAEEAIQALIKKLDANALQDKDLLEKLEAAGVIRKTRSKD